MTASNRKKNLESLRDQAFGVFVISFSRERNTTVGKVAGTGLGMEIVKKYVNLMGGSIDVKSELGKGTVFTLILTQKSG